MKPLKLVMRAFGPYADEQVLDFRELGHRTLFLVHGATGAGKSTILDAICFALFGESSGGDKPKRSLRSDHADSSVVTEATLEFSLGRERYRIWRRPDQEIKDPRNEAIRTIKPRATVWKLGDSGQECPDKTVLATGWQNVSAAIEDLLGFRKNQFRQVVMLPQGKFLSFLQADSAEREQILEVLFQTAFYKQIEEALRQEARQIESSIQETRSRREFILQQADTESEAQLLQALENTGAVLKQVSGALLRFKEVEKTARDRLAHAIGVQEKLVELTGARRAFQALEVRTAEIDGKRSVLEKARKASTLLADEKALIQRAREAEEASRKLAASRKSLEGARITRERAEEAFNREKQREEERDAARRELSLAEQMVSRVKELDEPLRFLAAAGGESELREKELREARQRVEDLVEAMQDRTKAGDEARKTAEQLKFLKERVEQAQRQLADRKRLDELSLDRSCLEAERVKIARKLKQSEDALARARHDYKNLESAWIEGQAAILASGLAPGEPCPVCGSREHPGPASSDKGLPDEKALKQKAQKIENLEASLKDQEKEASDIEKRIGENSLESELLIRNLGESASRTPEELDKHANGLKRELKAAEKASKAADALSLEIEKLSKELSEAGKKRDEAEQRRSEAAAVMQRVKAIVEERERGIPEALRNLKAAQKALAKARKRTEELEAAFEKAGKDLATARENLSARQSETEAAQDADAVAAQRLLSQRQGFAARLSEEGFPDEESFKSAKRTTDEMEALEHEIRAHDRELSAARDRLDRALKAAENLEQPDLPALEAAAGKAKQDLEQALQREATLSQELKTMNELHAAFRKSSEELAAHEATYEIVGGISRLATGKNTRNITFQRFVLGALLDDVLLTASERLRIMSNGRFSLHRVDQPLDRRTGGGLDLEINDMYTGSSRPVSTLSGGESFLASLSLALGLADVVQSYSGGVHLDTVFVDEGFGTLDPEALELAFRALKDLQSTGRLVGIISHVPELKEQIDARLEVKAGRRGSTARFVVG